MTNTHDLMAKIYSDCPLQGRLFSEVYRLVLFLHVTDLPELASGVIR